MKSSLQCRKKSLNSSGFLWRALLGSLALHALAFGMLMPEWGGDGRLVSPDRVLRGQLALPALPAVEALPVPEPLSAARKPRQPPPLPLTMPSEPAMAAMVPEPAIESPPRSAVETGGVAVQRDTTTAVTMALAPEQRETGPDTVGLRQYRLALAGEARRFRRYPEVAHREGLAGTAEIRVAVLQGERLAELARSSGHAVLDAAALEMLRLAASRTPLPDSLRGQHFDVLLPVVFEVGD